MKFLFWCAFEHLDFRIPEFESLAKLFSVDLKWIFKNATHPWVIIDLRSEEDAKKLISRSISAKFCVHIWSEADNLKEFHKKLLAFPFDDQAEYLKEELTFKIHVESFMKKLSLPERVAKIETLDYVPTKGKVKLSHNDVTFCYFEFHG